MSQAIEKEKELSQKADAETQEILSQQPKNPAISILAQDIVTNGSINQVPVGGAMWYAVKGHDNTLYNVSLNSVKPKCSCSSKSICTHMIAVRYQMGLQDNFDIPPEFVKAYKADKGPKMPKCGTKKPKRTDTIHESITGSQTVVMKPTIMHLSLNDPDLTTVPEETQEELERETSPISDDGSIAVLPDYMTQAQTDDLEEHDIAGIFEGNKDEEAGMEEVVAEYNLENVIIEQGHTDQVQSDDNLDSQQVNTYQAQSDDNLVSQQVNTDQAQSNDNLVS